MQNIVNPQFLPQNSVNQTQYMQNPQMPQVQGYNQSYPSPSVGAVNIQIYNPTANPMGVQPVPYPVYPYNYNNMIQPSAAQTPQINPDMSHSMGMNNNANGVASQAEGEKGKKTDKEEDKKNKPKVALTDDYIKTLENYLNSQDKKIRLMGAKELLERFKEDETRKDDAALTALLNKTLQDPAETVKFVAMTALDTGYATGNDETAQILTQIQNSDSSYGEDAALASQILLKMSGYKANADAAALQNQNPQMQNQTQGQQNALSQNAQMQSPASTANAMAQPEQIQMNQNLNNNNIDNPSNQYMMNADNALQSQTQQGNIQGGKLNGV